MNHYSVEQCIWRTRRELGLTPKLSFRALLLAGERWK